MGIMTINKIGNNQQPIQNDQQNYRRWHGIFQDTQSVVVLWISTKMPEKNGFGLGQVRMYGEVP